MSPYVSNDPTEVEHNRLALPVFVVTITCNGVTSTHTIEASSSGAAKTEALRRSGFEARALVDESDGYAKLWRAVQEATVA